MKGFMPAKAAGVHGFFSKCMGPHLTIVQLCRHPQHSSCIPSVHVRAASYSDFQVDESTPDSRALCSGFFSHVKPDIPNEAW